MKWYPPPPGNTKKPVVKGEVNNSIKSVHRLNNGTGVEETMARVKGQGATSDANRGACQKKPHPFAGKVAWLQGLFEKKGGEGKASVMQQANAKRPKRSKSPFIKKLVNQLRGRFAVKHRDECSFDDLSSGIVSIQSNAQNAAHESTSTDAGSPLDLESIENSQSETIPPPDPQLTPVKGARVSVLRETSFLDSGMAQGLQNNQSESPSVYQLRCVLDTSATLPEPKSITEGQRSRYVLVCENSSSEQSSPAFHQLIAKYGSNVSSKKNDSINIVTKVSLNRGMMFPFVTKSGDSTSLKPSEDKSKGGLWQRRHSLPSRLLEESSQLYAGNVSMECAVGREKFPQGVIDAVLGKAGILRADGRQIFNVRVRKLYETIYSGCPLLSRVLCFLQSQPRVRVMIDTASGRINRMKPRFVDLDGISRDATLYPTFADLKELTLYLGVGYDCGDEEYPLFELTESLSQMSLFLAFENEGKPYSKGDTVHEREYRRIVKEAKKKRKKEGEKCFHWRFRYALDKKTRLAKEVYLISAIPYLIAVYGTTKGKAVVKQEIPALLEYYERHVMAALL